MTPIASRERYPYSSIGSRPRFDWPNGRRLAVYVAVGVEEYDFGSGLTENVLEAVPQPDLVNTSWRDYGNRVGVFRIFDRLERLGIEPALLLNTDVYDSAPDVIAAARRVGAEFVAHGRSNSDILAGLDPVAEARYLRGVAERIRAEEGSAPLGWSSPWLAHTPATLDLLAEAGFRYLLDLRMDDQPIWLRTATEPVLSVPYALELNDSTTMIGRNVSPRDFADMIVDEFDELLSVAEQEPVVLSVVVHSFITGAPFRLRPVMRALEHIAAHRDRIWLTQPGAIYEATVRARSALDE